MFIGVDPHKLPDTIEVVDGQETVLGMGLFGTDKAWASPAAGMTRLHTIGEARCGWAPVVVPAVAR